MDDHFDLRRFVEAQNRDGMYERALFELRRGCKSSHWIWFVFPQIAGLGSSQMAQTYAIASLEEARAYLAHSVLGPRLVKSAEALLALPQIDPVAVLGEVDAMKLRSSMTLFAHVDHAPPCFTRVLAQYYDGVADKATEQLVSRS
jgi:uncharacterized protein (DUF1810 family)